MNLEIEEKLKLPACSNWIDLEKQKPKRFQYVLVNTQYCKYPAQTAMWNGIEFKSTDGLSYSNITHWAEINDLGQKLEKTEFNDIENLNHSILCIEQAFHSVSNLKIKNENIEIIFESLGFIKSELIDESKKIKM